MIHTWSPLEGFPDDHLVVVEPANYFVGEFIVVSGAGRLMSVAEIIASQQEVAVDDDPDADHDGGWVTIGNAPDCHCEVCRKARKVQHRARQRETYHHGDNRREFVRARERARATRRNDRRRYEMPD
jgi:hypothetical protein